ncbi:hypothetical protein RHMOL_Rhmol04G0135800 [Rhododendron molle]|uniref:Uncharacterized protein n=1 Tax=Rhododendron molle TaxID=49168 RepID=A0ACC0P0E2_RHOML|nr:hypothetical protein RHMOL_Rhmol04G0135800 [Rhododendron molle]
MARQTELNELKKTMEEMSQKMDKMLTLVQGLVNLFTSIIPNKNVGLNDDVGDLRADRADKLFSKVKLSEMFKDLAEILDDRAHSKEDTPLTKTSAEMHIVSAEIHEINPRGKRICPVDSKRLYGCKASYGLTDLKPLCVSGYDQIDLRLLNFSGYGLTDLKSLRVSGYDQIDLRLLSCLLVFRATDLGDSIIYHTLQACALRASCSSSPRTFKSHSKRVTPLETSSFIAIYEHLRFLGLCLSSLGLHRALRAS